MPKHQISFVTKLLPREIAQENDLAACCVQTALLRVRAMVSIGNNRNLKSNFDLATINSGSAPGLETGAKIVGGVHL